MARPLRLEYSGALYHVTARGNEQRDIFRDDDDRHRFLRLLGETATRFGWNLIAWVLMSNHYHLEVETPEANLSRGMHWLNGRYAQWFNRKHKRVGHLFQGRFKGLLIEKESYLLEVARYIVLNPVRANMVARPEEWRWSSYRATAGLEEALPGLACPTLIGLFGNEEPQARLEYKRFIARFDVAAPSPWTHLTDQVYLGSKEWLSRLQSLVDGKPYSCEYPRVQMAVGRPGMSDVLNAVAATFDTVEPETRNPNNRLCRQLVAYIAFHDGLVRQSEIAATLGIRGRGAVGYLIAECARALIKEPALGDVLTAVRARMHRRLPEHLPPPDEFTWPFHRKRAYIPGAP